MSTASESNRREVPQRALLESLSNAIDTLLQVVSWDETNQQFPTHADFMDYISHVRAIQSHCPGGDREGLEFHPPDWAHVQAAYLMGAREARENPEATEPDFRRAADGLVLAAATKGGVK